MSFIESLADLGRNGHMQAFRLALGGGGPADHDIRRHFVHFVRVVDLAVEEYERARSFLELGQAPGGDERVIGMLRAVDHLELCLVTLARALNALSAISGEESAPPVPGLLRKKSEAVSAKFREVRNTVVHVEEYLVRREFSEGQSHALRIDLDGSAARIGKQEITMASLAKLLRDLHGLATDFAEYRESRDRE